MRFRDNQRESDGYKCYNEIKIKIDHEQEIEVEILRIHVQEGADTRQKKRCKGLLSPSIYVCEWERKRGGIREREREEMRGA